MTFRQKLYKSIYPLFRLFTKKKEKDIRLNLKMKTPLSSFYNLTFCINGGSDLHFEYLRGKKTLIVNTASDCIYTPQYAELEKLYEQYKDNLHVLAFPSNDFGGQERADDHTIAEFCETNFNLNFPIMKKSIVSKEIGQNEVYEWLTDPELNGWNEHAPQWNFSKYLIDEEGVLTHYFDPSVSPLSKEVVEAIEL